MNTYVTKLCPDLRYGRDVFIQKLNISEALWNSLQTGHAVRNSFSTPFGTDSLQITESGRRPSAVAS